MFVFNLLYFLQGRNSEGGGGVIHPSNLGEVGLVMQTIATHRAINDITTNHCCKLITAINDNHCYK